jgi:hypothetical protein
VKKKTTFGELIVVIFNQSHFFLSLQMIQHLNLVGGSFRVDSLEDKLDEANGDFSESVPEIIGENYELKLSNDIFIDNKKVLYPDDCIEVKTEKRTKNTPETVPVFSFFF